MIKIKLECWWTNTGSLNNRMIKQFVFDEDLKNYEFVDSNPDYTIVFGRTDWKKLETPKDKTFYISQEPLWSPNQPKNDIHNYCSKILVSDKRDYPDREEYIETLLPMFYAGRGEFDHREQWDWSKKLRYKDYEKNKIVSMIVRKDYSSYYNQFENPLTNKINYKTRTDLGIELSKNPKIDISGNNWENNGTNLKGEIFNKHLGLDEYKFSIACENSLQKNYISEKFWDLILTDTVPIYLGCTNVNELISEEIFINLNGLEIPEMINKIEYIIQNETKLYDEYKLRVKKLKEEYFTNPKYNLWERIKVLVNE